MQYCSECSDIGQVHWQLSRLAICSNLAVLQLRILRLPSTFTAPCVFVGTKYPVEHGDLYTSCICLGFTVLHVDLSKQHAV